MPLIKSGSKDAFKANVGTLMHDVGKSPHVQSRDQALAIAYSTARRAKAKYASGGGVPHQGFLASSVPGRTDKLPITVQGGAYVLPADHVAAIGQGNSLAGADIANKMFKMGPYGSTQPPSRGLRAPRQKKFAEGGDVGEDTPIVAAGGEIVVPPDRIMERFGDLDKGHKALDQWVIDTRKKHIQTLRGLKPPKKD